MTTAVLAVLAVLVVIAIIVCPRQYRARTGVSGKIFFELKGMTMSKLVLHTDSTSATATVVVKDAQGNPVTFSVPPVWTLGAAIATLTPSADGTSATLTGPFTVGDTNVDVLVDAADMENGQPAHFTGEVQVLAAGGVTGEVDFGPVT